MRNFNTAKKRKLLILDFGGLGDGVIIAPIIAGLQREAPDIQIFHTDNPLYGEGVFEDHLPLKNIVARVPQSWSFFDPQDRPAILQFIQQHEITDLFNLQPDIEYIGQYYSFKNWLTSVSPIRITTFPFSLIEEGEIASRVGDDIILVLRNAGFSLPAVNWQWLSEVKSTSLKAEFRIGIFVGSYMPPKRWPLESWVNLLCKLTEKYSLTVDLYAGVSEDELEFTNELLQLLISRNIDVYLQQKLSLRSIIDKLAHCKLLISNDSGIAHLAAAISIPTIVLYWASDAGRWMGHSPSCLPIAYDHFIPVDVVLNVAEQTVRLLQVSSTLDHVAHCCQTSAAHKKYVGSASSMNRTTIDDRFSTSSVITTSNHSAYFSKKIFENRLHKVSVEDFNVFVCETGYITLAERWGYSWLMRGSEWVMTSGLTWRQRAKDVHNAVIHISWWDANAFCQWMNATLRTKIRLPTLKDFDRRGRKNSSESASELGIWCLDSWGDPDYKGAHGQERRRYVIWQQNKHLSPTSLGIRADRHCDNIGFSVISD